MSFAPVPSRADPPQASFERLDQRFGEARPFPPDWNSSLKCDALQGPSRLTRRSVIGSPGVSVAFSFVDFPTVFSIGPSRQENVRTGCGKSLSSAPVAPVTPPER